MFESIFFIETFYILWDIFLNESFLTSGSDPIILERFDWELLKNPNPFLEESIWYTDHLKWIKYHNICLEVEDWFNNEPSEFNVPFRFDENISFEY